MVQQVRTVHAPEYMGILAHEGSSGRSSSFGHGPSMPHHSAAASPEPPVIPPGYAMVAPNVLVPISALMSSQAPAHQPQQSTAYASVHPYMQVCASSQNHLV